MVRTKNIIITVVAVLLLLLLAYGVYSMIQPEVNNTTDELNISMNETNETLNNITDDSTDTTVKTTTKESSKQSTGTTKKSSDDGVYYDEELNEYFDSNGKTVRDAQYPKGTSREQMKKDLEAMKQDFD